MEIVAVTTGMAPDPPFKSRETATNSRDRAAEGLAGMEKVIAEEIPAK